MMQTDQLEVASQLFEDYPMSNQTIPQKKIIVSIDGLNEVFEVPVIGRAINLASNIETACVFLTKRLLDEQFDTKMKKDSRTELGFSVTDKEISILSHFLTPQLLSYSHQLLTDNEHKYINPTFTVADRNKHHVMVAFTLSLSSTNDANQFKLAG